MCPVVQFGFVLCVGFIASCAYNCLVVKERCLRMRISYDSVERQFCRQNGGENIERCPWDYFHESLCGHQAFSSYDVVMGFHEQDTWSIAPGVFCSLGKARKERFTTYSIEMKFYFSLSLFPFTGL